MAAQARLLPVTQMPSLDVKQRYVAQIKGVPIETYIDWMKSCYYVTATGLPAASVPCGFTPEGLPVGSRSWGATGTIWACCSWPTPSRRPPGSGRPDPRWSRKPAAYDNGSMTFSRNAGRSRNRACQASRLGMGGFSTSSWLHVYIDTPSGMSAMLNEEPVT
jgi:hypothetical protein